jgi:hypothetical protein
MKWLLIGMGIFALGLYAYQRSHQSAALAEREARRAAQPQTRVVTKSLEERVMAREGTGGAPPRIESATPPPRPAAMKHDEPRFHCDGRVYCSQMTSCAEATFFLENCPGVKMDGGAHDGVPCERQWCGQR